MADNWQFNIKHVNPGEPVEAGVVNRPNRALADRTAYLKDRLDAAEAGKAIIDLGATVASNVLPGHAVYWNADRQQYELALAAFNVDADTGGFVLAPSAECVGLCYQKTAENKADVALSGLVRFKDLTASIGQIVEPGKYFLSAAAPGKLAKQKPPITAPICYVLGLRDNCTTDVYVLVCPQIKDSFDEHVHFRVELSTASASTAADIGWLQANHASFNNKAPAGATYGYNIAADKKLSNVWPPVPLSSVAILRDKGDGVDATEIHLDPAGKALVNLHGIWWLDSTPPTAAARLIFVGTRLLVGNIDRAVASLRARDNSPIVVNGCAAEDAATGDLNVDANYKIQDCPPLTDEDHELGAEQGGKIFVTAKSIDDLVTVYENEDPAIRATVETDDVILAAEAKQAGQTLNTNKNYLCRGWITEGIVAHELNQFSISSTWERKLTNAEKVYLDFTDDTGEPVVEDIVAHQGLLKINFDGSGADRELSPQIVRLDDAVERIYNDIPYLAFPAGQDSAIRVRLNVPFVNTLGGSNLKMKIRALVFKTVGSTTTPAALGRLFMSYRVIRAPGADEPYLPLAAADVEDDNNFPATLTAPKDNLVSADSVAFSVQRGDTVLVTFSRASDDSTPGEIGLLRIAGILFNQPNENV